MTVLSAAASIVARGLWRRFERVAAEPVAAQLKVLAGLLRRAADTEWGRAQGLVELRSPQEFRRRVELAPYEQAAPLWHRAFEGRRDVTWPGHVKYFALSSGTTAGNKLLPVTREAIRSNRRSGAMLAAALVRRGGARGLFAGRFLYLGGTTALRQRGQCLFGDASGIMARHMPLLVRRRHLPEPQIAAIANWEEKIARVVQRYLRANVSLLGACPSWAALLFKQLRCEAERQGMGGATIGELWPALAHFVSYGMAFGPYRGAFEEYIGRPIHCTDTYSSSEAGMTAIQVEAGGPLRLIVDNGVFFEFIPADQIDRADAPRLHLGEVSEGVNYAVIVSTNGGIWAYPLGDVVRFESLRPPAIVFAGRTRMLLSAFGEHVTLEMIERAVTAACQATSALVADYTIWPRFPSPREPRAAHRWLMEFDRPPDDPARFAATLDESIRRVNEDYDTHRADDYGLEPPVLLAMARGTFYEYMKRQGKLGGQHKVPRVAADEMGAAILAISQSL